jgi:uncharacterized membrane protein
MKSAEEKNLQISKGVNSQAGKETGQSVGFTRRSVYSGPIPTPQMFAEFEKVLPGSADRILTMAEDQSKHRHKIENWVVWFDGGQSILGLLFAFLVVIVALCLGAYLIMNDKPVSGLATIVLALGTIVGTMIYRQTIKKRNEEAAGKE